MVKILAFILAISLLFAITFNFLGLPYLLGYIGTGIFLSTFLSKNSHNLHLLEDLGEMGLLLLIFMIGIELDLLDFKQRWKKASSIFSAQIALTLAIIFGINFFFPLPLEVKIFFLCLSIFSSTGVVFKILDEMKMLQTQEGSLISNLLILQDLAVIPFVILLKNLKAENLLLTISWKIFASIFIIFLLISYLNQKKNKTFAPLHALFENNAETITIAALSLCLLSAVISEHLGFSNAYGPFLLGLVIGSFGNKSHIIQFAKPIESLLMMVFFIFVGTKINLPFIKENYVILIYYSILLLVLKFLVTFGSIKLVQLIKNQNNFALITMNQNSTNTTFVAIMLAQTSEFSFNFLKIVANQGILSEFSINLLNTLMIISLSLGALWPILYINIFKKKKQ